MDIKSLLDLTCAKVASMIKGLFLLKRFLSRRHTCIKMFCHLA